MEKKIWIVRINDEDYGSIFNSYEEAVQEIKNLSKDYAGLDDETYNFYVYECSIKAETRSSSRPKIKSY